MQTDKAQAVISIIIVGAFVVVSSIIALAPVLGGYPPAGYTEHLKSYTSVYAGAIGLVLGYYFGKATAKSS